MADQVISAKCGFFDSVNQDRLYSADEMNRPYRRIISNGVFASPQGTPSTDLQVVSANNGMKIVVKAGQGIFADKWFELTSNTTITVPSNTNISPRRDSVIVQVDKRISGRVGNIIYRTGTPSSNPQPPAIGTVDSVYEYRLANIYVAAGATAINNDGIVDLRGSSECPWVTSLIKQVDTSQLYNQWQTAYENYYNTETQRFNAFMESLTEDLNVSSSIALLSSTHTTSAVTATIPINITGFDRSTDGLMVFINGQRTGDFTISTNSANITLGTSIAAGQKVDFVAFKSIIDPTNTTAMDLIEQIDTKVNTATADTGWINFILESNATAFDSTTTPGIRKCGKEVFIRGAIKGLNTLNTPICTLPENMRPSQNHQYAATAITSAGAIAGNVVLEVKTTGSIYIVARSTAFATTAKLSIATSFIVG